MAGFEQPGQQGIHLTGSNHSHSFAQPGQQILGRARVSVQVIQEEGIFNFDQRKIFMKYGLAHTRIVKERISRVKFWMGGENNILILAVMYTIGK